MRFEILRQNIAILILVSLVIWLGKEKHDHEALIDRLVHENMVLENKANILEKIAPKYLYDDRD